MGGVIHFLLAHDKTKLKTIVLPFQCMRTGSKPTEVKIPLGEDIPRARQPIEKPSKADAILKHQSRFLQRFPETVLGEGDFVKEKDPKYCDSEISAKLKSSVYSRRTFWEPPNAQPRPVREVQVKVEFLVADGDVGSARPTRLNPSDKQSCEAD